MRVLVIISLCMSSLSWAASCIVISRDLSGSYGDSARGYSGEWCRGEAGRGMLRHLD